ncbi:MAG: hypothetical protein KI792_08885, partial [Alphaproteobacteria bacterium]|nr:hypothetical protein [Alphaproteobacteria bacterium SS10]
MKPGINNSFLNADIFFWENVDGEAGNDTIIGDGGGNVLIGGEGDDEIKGGAGSDTLIGDGLGPFESSGSDQLTGGGGNDYFVVDSFGDDKFWGHAFSTDTVVFGEIYDSSISFDLSDEKFLYNDTSIEFEKVENVVGSRFDDFITGDSNDNVIYGGGADVIGDVIFGSGGNDVFYGGRPDNVLDIINNESRISYVNNDYSVSVNFGSGIVSKSNNDQDQAFGFRIYELSNKNDDVIISDLSFLDGIASGTFGFFNGLNGVDTLDISGIGNEFDVNFNKGTGLLTVGDKTIQFVNFEILIGPNGALTYFGDEGIEDIRGNDAADIMYGDGGDDVISGGGGNDGIYGGAGNDTIEAGQGNSVVYGDADDDVLTDPSDSDFVTVLYGGDGDDTLYGGANGVIYGDAGSDVFYVTSGTAVYAGLSDVAVFGSGGTLFIDGAEVTELTEQEDGSYHSNATGSTAITLIDGRAIFGAGDNAFIADSVVGLGITTTPFQSTVSPDSGGGAAGSGGKFFKGDNINPDGEGPDNFPGSPVADNIDGTSDRDTIDGYQLNDVLNGLGGNDNINGGDGNDQLDGGPGSDVVSGDQGNDVLVGGTGNDTLHGVAGNNTLSGGSGQDQLNGGNNNDILNGESGFDDLNGGGGQDTLKGGDGRDNLDGGSGNDSLDGGDHADYLDGDGGNDTVNGGDGRDTIVADSGDQADGGNDYDLLTTNNVTQVDLVNQFQNFEKVSASGSNVTVEGGSLSTDFFISLNASGNGQVNTGSGHDKITVSGSSMATVDAGGGHNSVSLNSVTSYSINAGDGYDEISVAGTADGSVTDTGGNNDISVGIGNATVETGEGDDTISAGMGDASITDSGGNNRIDIGAGNSTISTAIGSDTISAGDGDHTITDTGAADDANHVSVGEGASDITMGDGADTINLGLATGDGHLVDAGAGNDLVTASGNRLDISLGEGSDTLDASAITGNVTVTGGEGDDHITLQGDGQFFVDVTGAAENFNNVNIIKTGGSGTDTVVGGASTDHINVNSNDGNFFIDLGNDDNADVVTINAERATITALGGDDKITSNTQHADILTGDGDDTINFAADSILAGDATIESGAGDDFISASRGDFIINTGTTDAGADVVSVWSSASVLSNATINTGDGVDYILVNGANFTIDAGQDDFADTVIADQADFVDVTTGGGDDYVRVDGQQLQAQTSPLVFTVNTGDDADTILSLGATNIPSQGTIVGGDGDDYVDLNKGAFSIDVAGTDAGNDSVRVFSGSGTIEAGDGSDTIRADGTVFTIDIAGSDDSRDFAHVTADTATILGGEGSDSIQVRGDDFVIDVEDVVSGDDTVSADVEGSVDIKTGAGADSVTVWGRIDLPERGSGFAGSVTLNTEGGDPGSFDDDVIDVRAVSATITSGNDGDLITGSIETAVINAGGNDTAGDTISLSFSSAATIIGGEGADSIQAVESGDLLIDVEDQIFGDDTVKFEASGSVLVRTGVGDDLIDSNANAATILGGEGADSVIASGEDATRSSGPLHIDVVGSNDDHAHDYINISGGNATILAGGGADTVQGGVGDILIDVTTTPVEGDTVTPEPPDDLGDFVNVSITGGSAVTIAGGNGADTIDARGDDAAAVRVDVAGDDIADDHVITRGQFADIRTGAGSDTISHASGDFYIDASIPTNDADDLLIPDDDSIGVSGGAGTIIGGHGDDSIQVSNADGYVLVDASTTVAGGDDNDTVLISGSAVTAIVYANAGDDEVSAFASSVEIYATGAGANNLFWSGAQALVFAGDGADTIGGSGFDNAIVYGYSGDDFLELFPAEDASSIEFYGGSGSDTVTFGSTPFNVAVAYIDLGGLSDETDSTVNIGATNSTIIGTNGDNSITVDGIPNSILTGDGADTVFVGNPNVESDVDLDFDLGEGDNHLTIVNPDGGSVVVGSGDDYIEIEHNGAGSPTAIDLFVGAGSDTVIVEGDQYEIYGLKGDDFIRMEAISNGQSTLFGGDGNDTIYAGNAGGGNLIDGGDGDDLIYGSDGGDTLRGGLGSDTIIGLAGDEAIGGTLDEIDGDFVKNFGSQASLTVEGLFGLTADGLSIEYVGDNTNITFDTPSGTKTITLDFGLVLGATPVEVAGVGTTFDLVAAAGGLGSFTETIIGTGDADQLTNTFDSLQWVIYGLDGADTLAGADRDDELLGGGGADLLYGFDGDDELFGGTGADTLFGGDGNDFFVGTYAELDGDYIEDIEIAGGVVIEQIGVAGVFDLDLTGITTSFDGTYTTLSLSSASGSADIFIRGEFSVQETVVEPGEGTAILLSLGGPNLAGTSNADSLEATTNEDWAIYGKGGNDSIFGAGGDDILYGEDGEDFIYGAAGDDVLDGGDGEDFILGEAGNDTLVGGAGNDALIGGAGADLIYLGGGDDLFAAEDVAHLEADTIEGLGADDQLLLVDQFGVTDSNINTVYSNGITTVTLTEGGNSTSFSIIGNFVANSPMEETADPMFSGTFISFSGVLAGTSGDDLIDVVAGGATYLDGGDGADTITVTDGDNLILGQLGDDVLSGADGADSIDGGNGNDTIYGNLGADLLYGALGNDLVYGGDGNDQLLGGDGADTLDGGDGADTLTGGGGADLFYLSSDGGDTINGGSGIDAIDASGLTHGVTVHLWNSVFGTGGYDNDITGIEIVYGTASGDVFWSANNINDTFYGGDGSDTFYISKNGGDYRAGGDGAYRDLLVANGSAGNDIDLAAGTAVLISDTTGIVDTLIGFEDVDGSIYGDIISGDAGDNELVGHGGDDVFFLTSGTDTIDGGSGSDAVDASGLTHGVTVQLWERIFQSGGDSTYVSGIDIVYGTASGDVFWSANNISETFYGGDGSDTFYIGNNGGDYRDGEGGADWITAANRNGGVNINFSANKSTNEDGDEDTLHNIEHAIGSGFNDTITGDLNNNQ